MMVCLYALGLDSSIIAIGYQTEASGLESESGLKLEV